MDILNYVLTFIIGMGAGSFLTLQIKRSNTARDNSKVVDQAGARAGRDIVGGDKTEKR